ncbi:hypothetical protein Q7P37_002031 [Cladosporium fusiforme]
MERVGDHHPKVCKKIGCDGALPSCGKCEAAGAECTSSTSLRRKTTPRKFGKSKNDEVERLKTQVTKLQDTLAQQRGSRTQEPPHVNTVPVQNIPAAAGSIGLSAQGTAGQSRITDSASGSVIRHLGRLVHVPSGSMFAGSTTGVHFIRSVEQKWQSLADSSDSFPECLFRMHLLPTTAASRMAVAAPSTSNYSWESLLQRPMDYYLGRLQRFLAHWGTMYPIFCRQQVTRAFTTVLEQAQLATNQIDRTVLHKLLLVMAIDAWVEEDSPNGVHALTYYNAARLLEPEAFDELRLEAVQSHILNAIFLQLAGKHASLASAVGAAVRAAQCIGLHRHPRRFKICAGETELRTRLWWCVAILDISTSIAYGLPKIISDHDVDVGLPTNCDFDDMRIAELPVPLPGESTQTSIFIALAKLSSIMQQFTWLLFTTTERRDGESKINKLDRQLRVWQYEHSDLIEHGKADSNAVALHLHVLAHFCLLLIHQPGLTLEEENPQFARSMTASLHCATSLLRVLTEARNNRMLSCLQPNAPRLIFQCGLICLYYAWHNQTISLPEADCFSEPGASACQTATLSLMINMACTLLTSRSGELPVDAFAPANNDYEALQESLQHATNALRSMSDKTYALFGESQHTMDDAQNEFDGSLAMQSIEDWPSSLWQLNADDISEWTEGFTLQSMDTFLPDFSLE